MLIFLLLIIGVAAFFGAIMLLFFAATGEPPTPRRMIVRLTARVRRFSQTIGYGPSPKSKDGSP
ncbi:MAG: hypothetical protein SF187_27760 [Deltaproteobacteria bacterium]|nr:hypothetical protein [Deltaproteobacteria bacterium]